MAFQVLIHKKAQRKLQKLRDKNLRERLKEVFRLLSEPFLLDTVKIEGEEKTYRTRIGKYRILYIIEENVVYIMNFDTRGKVYK